MTGKIGQRSFDDARWRPLEKQLALGLSLAEPIEGPFWLEGGSDFSSDTSTVTVGANSETARARLYDFYVGLLLQPELGGARLRPYGALGLVLRTVDLEEEILDTLQEDSDVTFGGYGKFGLRFDVYPGGFVGLEVRVFEGEEARLSGRNLDTSSYEILFVSGTGF